MIELMPSECRRVLPLLKGIRQAVLPWAICEGVNPGRVFVDRRDEPQLALIWSPVGYYFLAGAVKELDAVRQVLTETFIPASQADGESGFILIPGEAAWKAHLAEILPGRNVIEIYRRPFVLERERFAAVGDRCKAVPPGFRLVPLTRELAERVDVLRVSWASLEDFHLMGMGFALLDGDRMASVCLSLFASHNAVEIDMHTDEAYRRRGFALLTAAALIEECLRRGLSPNWECFWENEPSVALAERLGFRALPDYPVYYWEE